MGQSKMDEAFAPAPAGVRLFDPRRIRVRETLMKHDAIDRCGLQRTRQHGGIDGREHLTRSVLDALGVLT
jgi:hypothetical protein